MSGLNSQLHSEVVKQDLMSGSWEKKFWIFCQGIYETKGLTVKATIACVNARNQTKVEAIEPLIRRAHQYLLGIAFLRGCFKMLSFSAHERADRRARKVQHNVPIPTYEDKTPDILHRTQKQLALTVHGSEVPERGSSYQIITGLP